MDSFVAVFNYYMAGFSEGQSCALIYKGWCNFSI